MLGLSQNGYTEDEVLAELRSVTGSRTISFRYELLDEDNAKVSDLSNVLSGSVSYNYLADINRTARFTILDDGTINYLNQRIKPWARLSMPVAKLGGVPVRDIDVSNGRFAFDVDGWTAVGGTLAHDTEIVFSSPGSAALTPDGTTEDAYAEADEIPVLPERDYRAAGYLYSATGYASCGVCVDWYDSSHDYLESSNNLSAAASGVWTARGHSVTSPEGAAYARLVIRQDGTPPSEAVLNFDNVSLRWDDSEDGPFGPENWAEWPLGVFLLASPARKADASDVVTRDVEGYDQCQVYRDDLVDGRYTVAAGTNYITAISTLLDRPGTIPPDGKNLTPTTKTLPTAREWEPGTPVLTIIRNLLSAINYETLFFDENGVAIARPYVSPTEITSTFTYADGETSVIVPEVSQSLDLFSVPNKWVMAVNDPDRDELRAVYTNNNPASITSTVLRGRTITDFRTDQDAADQASLDAQVSRIAFEASQVYEVVEFDTATMPIHGHREVITLTYTDLSISDRYAEHTWSMNLEAGSTMKHSVRRVVNVTEV